VIVVGNKCSEPDCSHEHPRADEEPYADFGYTVGLFDLFDLPEIHLPAYPVTVGEAPLAPILLCHTINVLAAELIRGDLEAGGEVRVPLCEHRSMVFSFGQPGPLDAVEAFQCTEGAECIPAQWWVDQIAGVDHHH
jgi:hypothetical protein